MPDAIEHPIAYPCGCVRVIYVNLRGWEDLRYRGNRLCDQHLNEIKGLGIWK